MFVQDESLRLQGTVEKMRESENELSTVAASRCFMRTRDAESLAESAFGECCAEIERQERRVVSRTGILLEYGERRPIENGQKCGRLISRKYRDNLPRLL